MSQLFDYFVCSRTEIEQWIEALEQQDEERQFQLESQMPAFTTIKGLGDTDFNILAACVLGKDDDLVEAVLQSELVKAFDEDSGPWVTSMSQSVVEAVGGSTVDAALIQRWVNAGIRFYEVEDRCREIQTEEVAKTFQELCRVAIEKRLQVYVCFYG